MQLHIAQATIHLSLPSGAAGLSWPALQDGIASTQQFTADSFSVAGGASEGVLTPPKPGESWPGQGGYYVGTQAAQFGAPARHLIAAAEEKDGLAFGPRDDVPGATSHADGVANTKALLAVSSAHAAAQWAAAHTAEGHSDFHLPSRLDLLIAYLSAPQLFQKSGWYWSSTQLSRHGACVQVFELGFSGWNGKDGEWRVRPFRWIHLDA